MNNLKDKALEALSYIQERSQQFTPQYGIVLGTGLGGLVEDVEIQYTIPYEEIPYFPVSTVESHSGKLLLGTLAGKSVVVMQGRFHYYEGYSMQEVTFPIRVLKLLGIQKLLISNAAGGLNPSYAMSDLMVIEDHINLCYENPLTGKNIDEWGDRFPDMFAPYDSELIALSHQVAKEHNITLQEGVYASVPGPNLETRAEYRYLRIIGGDAVGMSTVPEVIVAKHMNLPVFAVSVITDLCSPDHLKPVVIKEILEAAHKAETKLRTLFRAMISADN
ncbi:purine-nucleoside phosphorylase [Algivirga pacifica]|uniref:Purine nucleoside phosphorylase n=1 Tax=Algivirga pacifica TaxID=1162670 RepID=A0ABP9CY73_9BACT